MNESFNSLLFGRLCLILCGLCVSAASLFAEDFKTVRDGVEYAELTRTISGMPVKMNLLRLDLTKVRLDVVHAMDMAIGTETVSSMAKRHGAFAAINAGFFRFDKSQFAGDASEVLIVNNELLSESVNRRIALTIQNEQKRSKVEIGAVTVDGTLSGGSRLISTMFRVNCERKPGMLVVYTPKFGPTTLTDEKGVEVIVRNPRNSRNSIVQVRNPGGNSVIPQDGFVISLTSDFSVEAEVLHAVTYRRQRISFGPGFWPKDKIVFGFEDMIAGVPQLIKNGKIDITWEQEKASKSFVETRHPRTAVAKLKDGKFLMITVDGRSESSGGIGLYDLAALLLEFGATDAMNLDGGGSTTMYLDGKVVNKPSDKEGERKVSDAILVTLRKK